jgi:DNA polymerase-3 subunit gamma/tau
MSYQVLARKWRPRNFTELVGQEHVLRALVNALDNDRLHHAFLFTGTRGVGKTTIARILAKSLNCEEGVSSKPCGKCSACTEINEGRFVDLIEVDAASRTKVEDTRELLENVQYAPTRGRYKVYLIDEVHMLSTHSFNALLKTLEEPPPHVKFLLATTDPQKLPVTILSRCLQFNLKRLPIEQIQGHLSHILEQENIETEPAAVLAIARAADGSMRDALSLLDQAIAYGSGALKADDVRGMLGSIEQSHISDMLQALAAGDAAALLQRVENLAEQSPDFNGVLSELISTLHRIALAQAVSDAIDTTLEDHETIRTLAQQLSPQDVQLYYQIALIGRRDLALAPSPRGGFEMILLRMLAFKPTELADMPTVSSKPTQTAPASEHHTATKTAAKPAAPAESPAAAIAKSLKSAAAEKKTLKHTAPAAETAAPAATTQTTTTPVPKQPTASVAAKATATKDATPDNLPFTDWEILLRQLGLNGMTLQLALNCAPVNGTVINAQTLDLCISPGHSQLLSDSRRKAIEQAVQQGTGREVRVNIDIREPEQPTPAALAQQRRQQRQAAAVNEIENDSGVQGLIDTFGAQINPGSIQPVDE